MHTGNAMTARLLIASQAMATREVTDPTPRAPRARTLEQSQPIWKMSLRQLTAVFVQLSDGVAFTISLFIPPRTPCSGSAMENNSTGKQVTRREREKGSGLESHAQVEIDEHELTFQPGPLSTLSQLVRQIWIFVQDVEHQRRIP